MADPRRILLSGYYGFSNAGDEAVLAAIISGLKSLRPDVEITVLSASPEETAKTHAVRAVSRTSIPAVRRAVRNCDLMISGGGSLIQDATSLQSLIYYLGVIVLAKLYRRKVMVLGQGIGPLRRSISRRLAGFALKRVDLITLRDSRSADLLRELGVTRPPVRVTADPTFSLTPCSDLHAVELLSETGIRPTEDVVGVSLREWPESPELERAAAEALKSLAQQLPAKLLLITMHAPDDMLLAKRVQQMAESVAIQPRPWSPDELMGVLGRCRLVVAMRLHALIFAAASGVPSVGISYDPKVESFLTATGQECIPLAEALPGLLVEPIVEAWNSRRKLADRLSEAVPPMRESALENYRLAIAQLPRDA